MIQKSLSTICLIFLFAAVNAQKCSLPFIRLFHDSSFQLVVDGKPFLALAGELGNSTASDPEYMRDMWPRLKKMHLNTVLAPVYWELLEPTEGKFDFALVDSMLAGARKSHLKLVLLWFGTWKNSMSCYMPAWVKKDEARFERATNGEGRNPEILSAFDPDNLAADVKAFRALMQHLKNKDEEHTVLMIQVENEIGYLTDAREHTVAANKKFDEPIPPGLGKWLSEKQSSLKPEFAYTWRKNGAKTSGNWETVFGKSIDTDEIFQAWYYASYANAVARSGKEIYNLPMFVNAALNHRNVKPGQYPSAGPLPHLMDIWKAAAPSIDMLSPDYYNPRFSYYSDLYVRGRNPFFIPEINFDSTTPIKAFAAVGKYHTMGFSPFAIETGVGANNKLLSQTYEVLAQVQPFLYGSYATSGFLLDKSIRKDEMQIGDNTLTIAHDNTLGWTPESKDSNWTMGGAIIIPLSGDEFLVAGTGVVITVKSNKPNTSAGILQADDGRIVNGKFQSFRRLNGDQTHQGRHIRIPVNEFGIQKIRLYEYSLGGR